MLVALCTAPVMTPWLLVTYSTLLIHDVSAILAAQRQAWCGMREVQLNHAVGHESH